MSMHDFKIMTFYTYALRLSASAKKVFSEDSAATSWSWKLLRRPYWFSLVFFKVRSAWSRLPTQCAGDLAVGRTKALPSVLLRRWDCSRRSMAAFLDSKWAHNSYRKPYKPACRCVTLVPFPPTLLQSDNIPIPWGSDKYFIRSHDLCFTRIMLGSRTLGLHLPSLRRLYYLKSPIVYNGRLVFCYFYLSPFPWFRYMFTAL